MQRLLYGSQKLTVSFFTDSNLLRGKDGQVVVLITFKMLMTISEDLHSKVRAVVEERDSLCSSCNRGICRWLPRFSAATNRHRQSLRCPSHGRHGMSNLHKLHSFQCYRMLCYKPSYPVSHRAQFLSCLICKFTSVSTHTTLLGKGRLPQGHIFWQSSV